MCTFDTAEGTRYEKKKKKKHGALSVFREVFLLPHAWKRGVHDSRVPTHVTYDVSYESSSRVWRKTLSMLAPTHVNNARIMGIFEIDSSVRYDYASGPLQSGFRSVGYFHPPPTSVHNIIIAQCIPVHDIIQDGGGGGGRWVVLCFREMCPPRAYYGIQQTTETRSMINDRERDALA